MIEEVVANDVRHEKMACKETFPGARGHMSINDQWRIQKKAWGGLVSLKIKTRI